MASGRSARTAARSAFVETIKGVLHCISGDGLVNIQAQNSNSAVLMYRAPATLTVKGGGRLYLKLQHWYEVAQDQRSRWQVRTESYIYTVHDAANQEAVGYHYHPTGQGEAPVPVPHLHIYHQTDLCARYLPKVHLPTGRIAVEDIVEMLIGEFGVEPRPPYADTWPKVLKDARAKFKRLRRWSSWGQGEHDDT